MPDNLPSAFLPLYQHASSRYAGNAMIEIEYKVCVEDHCAFRYNSSTTTDGYQRGKVLETGEPSDRVNGLNVKAIAQMLTLLELLALLDINNLDQNHNAWPSLQSCYRPNLYLRADVACLIEKLQQLTENQRRDFLNSVLE
jgi:hypothetical protein